LVSLDGHAVQAVVALSSPPTSVTAGFGSLWVSHADDGTVTRVDLAKRTVRDTIKVGGGPNAIAAAGGSIWVANALDGTLSRIDPASDEVTQALAVGRLPTALAAGHGALWVANGSDGTVSRVDPVRGRVAATIRVGRAPSGIATASRTVWVTNESSGTVSRIDPATSAVSQTINVGDAPSSVAAAGRSVWILDRLDSTVSRLDEQSEAVTATIAIRGAPGDLAVSRGAAWVTNDSAGTVSRIDDQRATVTRVVRVGDGAAGLLATPEGIWAAVTPGGATHRGGTLTAVAASELDTLDPALTFFSHQLVGMTNDGLVAFNHVSGARGAQLVPDLALTLPTPTDHGRTYTFRLRPAIRYSTGAVVTARDVRRSLERVYELGSPATPFYDSITGAHACAAPAHHCDLSRGITTDDDAGTVTFHLRTPDPDFLYKLALPYADVLPASTPSRPAAGTLVAAGVTPVRLPATGPYVVAGYAPSRALRLVRNPHYREWSRAAQPAGYPDRITVRLGLDPAQGAALMLRGHGDFMANIGPAPARQRETLRTRHASQLRVNPLPQTNFLFFNTRVAPFDDVRVRRALNYALDRRRLVDRYGGRSTAQLTCQILPPQIPGYRRYCPYSRNPRADGIWRGPDLATARRLVAESGTRGARVVVWTTPTPQVAYDEARDVVTALRRLRYRASLRALPDHRFFRYTNDSDNRAQIVSGGWGLDYPAASDILVRLTCPYFKPGNPASQDPGGLCDPALDRKIKHATALQATQPDKAASLWSGIDRELVDRAIWLPTVTPRETDIVSRRVGNYRYHLMFGAMVDQMWVR
jgi:YVTN family beta-propeller protein